MLTARSQYETLRIGGLGEGRCRCEPPSTAVSVEETLALSESPDGGPGKAKVEILEEDRKSRWGMCPLSF